MLFMNIISNLMFYNSKDATPALVSVWVTHDKRPDMANIPSDTASDITVMMMECWDGNPQKRPPFQGKCSIVINDVVTEL